MKLVLVILFCLVCNGGAAQDAVIDAQRPQSVVRSFEVQTRKLQREFRDSLEAERKVYRDKFSTLKSEAIKQLDIALVATTRKGDLDGALAIRELITKFKAKSNEPPSDDWFRQQLARNTSKLGKNRKRASGDATAVATYDFLGLNRQVINTYSFLSDGSIDAAKGQCEATWLEMPEGYILFRYGPGAGYIVFEPPVDGLSSGHASSHGRKRYLRKKL